MQPHSTSTPTSWLAFELSILHRVEFGSIALPLTGDPALGTYLKRRRVRVTANNILQADWHRAIYAIQNNSESFEEADVEHVLHDVYMPGFKLANPALLKWFSETDAWWFDNLRRNIETLESPIKRSAAIALAIAVGDYAHSFTEQTREFRQPLSHAFRRLATLLPKPANNHQDNACTNKNPETFTAESTADLLFVRLPRAEIRSHFNERGLWREEWVRGDGDFWPDFENELSGALGSPVATKSQYLRMLDQCLDRAANKKHWAVSHIETGFIQAQEIADVIGKHRRVEAVYTKDFSELTGKKAVIITA
jgi:hypothetical protein